jgi:HEAT repeat protein
VWALLKIQPGNAELTKLAVPLLIKALSDERELVRAEVATSLGELGVAAKDALVPLQKVVAEDSSLMVRAAAAEAVKKLK